MAARDGERLSRGILHGDNTGRCAARQKPDEILLREALRRECAELRLILRPIGRRRLGVWKAVSSDNGSSALPPLSRQRPRESLIAEP